MTQRLSIIPPVAWEHGEEPPPVATLPELLQWQAGRIPDAEALVAGERRYTFAELRDEVRRAADGLARLGVGSGSNVALLVPNDSEWVVAAYAALWRGAVVQAFNTWVKAWDLRQLLEASCADMLIMAPSVRSGDLLGELRELAPDLWTEGSSAEFPALRTIIVTEGERRTDAPAAALRWSDVLGSSDDAPGPASDGDSTAYVLYTSGTTSAPKAVPLRHRALIENGFSIGTRMGLTEQDRVWLGSPLFWSYGCANAGLATMGHGSCLVLQDRFDAVAAAALIKEERVTAAYLLPSITSAFIEDALAGIRDVDTLRTGLVIGTSEEFRQASVELDIPELCNVYGSTETYGNCCVTPHTLPLEQRMICQGPPLSGVEMRVVDAETGQIVPLGETAEFQVRGRVMTGYLNNADATGEVLTEDGWFRSGDTGFIRENGMVSFVARATDMIKTSGINVSPAEVEGFIATHPDVIEVGVVGAPHPTRGEVVVAFLVLREGAELDAAEVQAFCKRSLAGFKVPWGIQFVDALPRTTTGKMMRRDLREPAAAAVDAVLAGSAQSA